jgi:hypothetical protein
MEDMVVVLRRMKKRAARQPGCAMQGGDGGDHAVIDAPLETKS